MADQATLDALQFALLLEYLESDFYTRGLAASLLIPATDRTVFNTLSAQETAHINRLKALIQGLGGTPIAAPAFDFSGKGTVPGFDFLPSQYATFTMLAQAFEDVGVRGYKGQITTLISDKKVLTDVLTIHSVEARHASEVRRLRTFKGWITFNLRDDLPDYFQPVYDGEQSTTQGSVNVAALAEGFGGDAGATQAFDEPLTKAQVLAIISPFIV